MARPLSNPNPDRRGVAAMEFAVCLPVLITLVFGSIQACDLIYLKHSLTTAAYEGSLEVARPDATSATLGGRINQVLELRGVQGGTYEVKSAAAIQDLNIGEPVVLTLRAPVQQNMMISGFIVGPKELSIDFECSR